MNSHKRKDNRMNGRNKDREKLDGRNKNNIAIKGHYVKNDNGKGYTWNTEVDSFGDPIPFVPGVDNPESLLNQGRYFLLSVFPQPLQ